MLLKVKGSSMCMIVEQSPRYIVKIFFKKMQGRTYMLLSVQKVDYNHIKLYSQNICVKTQLETGNDGLLERNWKSRVEERLTFHCIFPCTY